MRLREHLAASVLLALTLYRREPAAAAALVAGGVLIDIDHYVAYGSQTGDWSLSGVLHYAGYRARPLQRGDSLPRYGPMRTRAHQPLIMLPLVWLIGRRGGWRRGLAIGVTLHLLLDYLWWPWALAAVRRAGGRCQGCGQQRVLEPVLVRRADRRSQWTALCWACRREAAWYTDRAGER